MKGEQHHLHKKEKLRLRAEKALENYLSFVSETFDKLIKQSPFVAALMFAHVHVVAFYLFLCEVGQAYWEIFKKPVRRELSCLADRSYVFSIDRYMWEYRNGVSNRSGFRTCFGFSRKSEVILVG